MTSLILIIGIIIITVIILGIIVIIVCLKMQKNREDRKRTSSFWIQGGRSVGVQDGNRRGILYDEYNNLTTTMVAGQADVEESLQLEPPRSRMRLILEEIDTDKRYQSEVIDYVIVGREAASDAVHSIRISDNQVSRQHCRFYLMGGYLYVLDLNSTNHTYLNGRMISEAMPVQTGDALSLGGLNFYITIE